MSDGTTNTTTTEPAAKAAAATTSTTNTTESKASAGASSAGDVRSAFDGDDAGADAGIDKKTDAGEAKPGEEKKAPAPIELKLPDGVQYDAAELEALKKLATDSGLDSEKAQKLLEFDISREAARTKAAQAAADAQSEAWAKQVMADKELGGEKWAETKADIARARTHFGAPVASAQKFFQHVGLATHPVVVRMFAELGRSVKEDTVKGALTPAAPKSERKSDAELF